MGFITNYIKGISLITSNYFHGLCEWVALSLYVFIKINYDIFSKSDYKYGGGGDIMKTSTDTWTLDSRHVNLD